MLYFLLFICGIIILYFFGEGDFESIEPTETQIALENPHVAYLKDFLEQRGKFELCFKEISLINGADYYLRVGSKLDDGYECYFKIAQEDEFISELLKNPKEHIGKPLNIDYEYVTETNGGIFMYYKAGEFKK